MNNPHSLSRKDTLTLAQPSIRLAGGRIGPIGRGLIWALGPVLLLTALVTAAPAAPPPFDCFATSDLVRVFEDGYGQPPKFPAITLFGLRNELVSAQGVVVAREDLENVTIAVEPLRQVDGAGAIPPENLHWNFIEGILIQENTHKLQKRDLVRPAPAWFPDVLGENQQCSVRKGGQKAFYLTLRIPPAAPPGEYRSTVEVKANGATATMPLTLKVYPLTLPEERHIMVTEWFSTGPFRKHQADPVNEAQFYRLLKLYAENMAEHRQNVFRVGLDLVASSRTTDGKLRFDFSRFDRWAQVFWDTGRMDLLETGFVARFGEGGWSSTNIFLQEFSVKDESAGQRVRITGEEFLPEFLPALTGHLRQKGWLAKTVFHICDEPSDHNVMAWRKASEFVHRYAPELRRIDAIETPHCFDDLEIWVPKLDHLATWRDVYEQAQRQGNELWFYTVGIFQGGSLPNKTVDVPLIESRLLHWLNYRFGLKGYLHWGFNEWTDDPIKAPGEHRGDGWHVYPARDGLLNSLRWEQMRNGLQDYECLWLLENKTAQLRATLSPRVAALIEPARRGVEIASQVVADYQDYTKDPEVLYAARRQAIEETLDLEKSPRILVQTNPREHSTVAGDCAIDVHGWAEPGTTIKINGQAVSVASDGLFLEQLAPRQGKIVVEAEREGSKKTLVRKFKL